MLIACAGGTGSYLWDEGRPSSHEIARHAGFANPYHFSRRFSHAYGMPPGRLRRSPQSEALAPLATAGLMPVWNVLQES